MKFYLEVYPDKDQLIEAVGEEDLSIEEMVTREAVWMQGSGIGAGDCMRVPDENDQPLIDKVLNRIKEDIDAGDLTAIDELLKFVPVQFLEGYLPE